MEGVLREGCVEGAWREEGSVWREGECGRVSVEGGECVEGG